MFGNDYSTLDGTSVRDYIHVMGIAEGRATALDFLSENSGWHAINLGARQGYSVLEVVNAFERASGQKIPCRIVPRRFGDVAECYANPKKASALLKWQAKRTLNDMCLSAWLFQRQLVLDQ